MKSSLLIVVLALNAGLLTAGCANNRDIVAKTALGSRQDVFTELIDEQIQPGKATAEIRFTVKSNSSRFMWMYFKHTDPPYCVHLNIDGQATKLAAEPVLEDNPATVFDDPEGGTGWKYSFNKKLVLNPGKHKLIIALPVNDLVVEHDIVLRDGANTINLKPVYKTTRLRPYKGQSFRAGVKNVAIQVN